MKYICCDALKKRHNREIEKPNQKERLAYIFRFDDLFRQWQLIFLSDGGDYGWEYGAVKFCPWCGSKLHQRLDILFENILLYEYGLTEDEITNLVDGIIIIPEIVPKEFHSSDWWLNRKLFDKESYIYVPYFEHPIVTAKEFKRLEQLNFEDPDYGASMDTLSNFYLDYEKNHLEKVKQKWLEDKAKGIRE
jgi:hypothetical protein